MKTGFTWRLLKVKCRWSTLKLTSIWILNKKIKKGYIFVEIISTQKIVCSSMSCPKESVIVWEDITQMKFV